MTSKNDFTLITEEMKKLAELSLKLSEAITTSKQIPKMVDQFKVNDFVVFRKILKDTYTGMLEVQKAVEAAMADSTTIVKAPIYITQERSTYQYDRYHKDHYIGLSETDAKNMTDVIKKISEKLEDEDAYLDVTTYINNDSIKLERWSPEKKDWVVIYDALNENDLNS